MACPICGGGTCTAFTTPYVAVARCTNPACGHLFAEDPPVDAGVEPVASPGGKAPQFAERNERLLRYLRRRGFLDSNSRVLDFGSGFGHLAEAIASETTGDVVCIEADDGRRAHLRQRGMAAVASLGDVEESFDSAVMVEVLEHLEDPVATLGGIGGTLRPGGQLFFTTPSGTTRLGRRWTNAYDSPHHIHFFTADSLDVAMRRAGFDRFDLRVINAMYPRAHGRHTAASLIKDAVRPLRAKLIGHVHLTGFATKPDLA